MNAYVLLGGAIALEVAATTAMKSSNGFTKLLPSVLCVLGYCISFYLLAQTLKTIPTGVAYAIWSGVGIVLISTIAWLFHGQKLDAGAMLGMALIVAGVIVINVFSQSAAH
ncbi:SMR family transporter [Comamonas sp.]|uniref:SMR family transporter n=1 Tax=Comamonas sp. TaxID=34028 RepID=UPI00289705FB|nr:SMR family transporter [Comamonas sp.]